jgi:hypothetical protein
MQFEHSGSQKRFSRECKTPELSANSGVFYLDKLFIYNNLDSLAEREGFEPPIPVKVCLISSQVHSTGLCHLSVVLAYRNSSFLQTIAIGPMCLSLFLIILSCLPIVFFRIYIHSGA